MASGAEPVRVLVTTTSFQDTPGPHHDLLQSAGFELVLERGPLAEQRMLQLVGEIDGLLCGDDAITRAVIERATPRLKVISKYGIGVDKIDLAAATDLRVPVTYCPGVNHKTVAEHTFALLLAVCRNLVTECNHVLRGEWVRITGHELAGKRLGIVGMGRVGQEVALRGLAFDMGVLGLDPRWDRAFAARHSIVRTASLEDLLPEVDVVTLHAPLIPETHHMINADRLRMLRPGAVLINTARGELVDSDALAAALSRDELAGYGADVLDSEPPPRDHALLRCPNVVLTPHIASRTAENVVRQATMAVENLVRVLAGQPPLAQANPVGTSR